MSSVPIKIGPMQIGKVGVHIPSDFSHIADGAPDPTKLTLERIDNSLILELDGPANAAAEIYMEQPSFSRPNLRLEFDLTISGPIAVMETDIKATLGGMTANLSLQVNLARGGVVQTSDASQAWFDAPFSAPLKDGKHHYQIDYALTPETCSYVSLIVDGVLYMFDKPQQNIPITKTGWADGAIFQVQSALASEGSAVIEIDEAYCTWS